jgi:hypothetical protein
VVFGWGVNEDGQLVGDQLLPHRLPPAAGSPVHPAAGRLCARSVGRRGRSLADSAA